MRWDGILRSHGLDLSRHTKLSGRCDMPGDSNLLWLRNDYLRGRTDLPLSNHVQYVVHLHRLLDLSGHGDLRRLPHVRAGSDLCQQPDMPRHANVRGHDDLRGRTADLFRSADLYGHAVDM